MYKHCEAERTDLIKSNDAVIFLNPITYTVNKKGGNVESALEEDKPIGNSMEDIELEVVCKGIMFGKKDKHKVKRSERL